MQESRWELRWGRDTWRVRRLARMDTTAMLHMLARLMGFMGRAGLLAACLLGRVRGTAADSMDLGSMGLGFMDGASTGRGFTDAASMDMGFMVAGISVAPALPIAGVW